MPALDHPGLLRTVAVIGDTQGSRVPKRVKIRVGNLKDKLFANLITENY